MSGETNIALIIILAVLGFLVFLTICFMPFMVQEKKNKIVQRLGKFRKVAKPGLNFKMPWIDWVAGDVSLRLQQWNVEIETKTKDDVFTKLIIAIQFQILPDKVLEAFYKLTNPHQQMQSFVFNTVRAQVPKMTLDEVFEKKDDVAQSVMEELKGKMAEYGYEIIAVLINDIDPDAKVKQAMNEVNAQERLRKAAEHRGEAAKILQVKEAEGGMESKILQGKGIAGERLAIVDGLERSIELFQKGIPGATAKDVMDVLILTQYFDTLTKLGEKSGTRLIVLNSTPGAVSDIKQQITEAFLVGSEGHEQAGKDKAPEAK